MFMVLPEVRAAMEAHAREASPQEACGLVAVQDGVVCRYFPAENFATKRGRFAFAVVDPEIERLEQEGFEIGVFHSHPHTAAMISAADWRGAPDWRGKPYLVLSLTTGELRSTRL